MKPTATRDKDCFAFLDIGRKSQDSSGLVLPSKKRCAVRAAAIGVLLLLWAGSLQAETAAFDLLGPKIEVRVQREGKTLPISEVPSLQAADRLWIHPDLPDDQSVHYLMVVVFLRGATNPPPDSWFTPVEAWSKGVHEEGVYITVPEGAEEALVMLAPETGELSARCGVQFEGSQEHLCGPLRIWNKLVWIALDWRSIWKWFGRARQRIPNN